MTAISLSAHWTAETLAAARNGDKDAFAALISPLAPNLRRLACRLTRSPEDAEDVCQESILKAFTKLAQFTEMQQVPSDNFRCWLTKITVNSAIDCNRRKRAYRVVALEECEHALLGFYRTPGENPEASYARKERVRIVVDEIRKLPRQLRNVCLLRNVMDLSTKEVAAQLGISTTATRLRLFRAHDQLRKNLGIVAFERHRQHRRTTRSTSARRSISFAVPSTSVGTRKTVRPRFTHGLQNNRGSSSMGPNKKQKLESKNLYRNPLPPPFQAVTANCAGSLGTD